MQTIHNIYEKYAKHTKRKHTESMPDVRPALAGLVISDGSGKIVDAAVWLIGADSSTDGSNSSGKAPKDDSLSNACDVGMLSSTWDDNDGMDGKADTESEPFADNWVADGDDVVDLTSEFSLIILSLNI